MTKNFPHLHDITNDIPPLDDDAKIEILLSRDAPELLKVREFRNGPKGAPWAQKLLLGRTVSGQMCLDRVGGPVHVSACHTTLEEVQPGNASSTDMNDVAPADRSSSMYKLFQGERRPRSVSHGKRESG